MRVLPVLTLLAATLVTPIALAQGRPPGGPGIPVPVPGTPPAAPPAAPPASSVEALDAAAKAYVVGKWRTLVQQSAAGRVYETETVANYFADGNYAGIVTTAMPGSGISPISVPIRGTWTVKAMDAVSFVLVLKPENEAALSIALKIVDADTLETADGSRATRVR